MNDETELERAAVSDQQANGTATVTGSRQLTPVFKLLLFTITVLTLTSAVGGYGALRASAGAADAKRAAQNAEEIVKVIKAQTSPAANAARRQQLDQLVVQVGQTVDCNNAVRLKGLATSLEGLLGLPEGAVVITPCTPVTTSTTDPPSEETP